MEELAMKMEGERESKKRPTYCVTGASGFIGSWLVKTLLENGYSVHATVRDPAKCLNLLSLWTGSDRLRLFRADLNQENSFDEAVKGCDGVFHVAASMKFNVNVEEEENLENHVQSNIIDPAIKGTLNLLNSCLKSESVKRVVFTSSISTITARDINGDLKDIVDESCRTPIDRVWKAKASGWVYVLSKLLTEDAAYRFAFENGIDIVSVVASTVIGPFLTSVIPSSIRVLLSPITGDSEFFKILFSVKERMGSIGLAHVEDVCRAHIFLMEEAKAEGRYICCAQSCVMSTLLGHLAQEYPCSNLKRYGEEEEKLSEVPCEISTKKLIDLGFKYKHGIEDTIHQTITSCLDNGFLCYT